jgi:hypothetical protein
VPSGPRGYLVDACTNHVFDKEKTMITLTVIVIALGFGWAVNKLWTRAADALARKPVAAKAAEGVALN